MVVNIVQVEKVLKKGNRITSLCDFFFRISFLFTPWDTITVEPPWATTSPKSRLVRPSVKLLLVKLPISDRLSLTSRVVAYGRFHSIWIAQNWVVNWWHRKNTFSEIMGFIWLFRTTYLKQVHTPKKCLFISSKYCLFSASNSWDMGFWRSNCFILNSLI